MLVSCVAYQDGKKLGDIPKDAIGEYVKRPDTFVWVALKDPEPDEMAQEFTPSPSRTRATGTNARRPRNTPARSSWCCKARGSR